MYISLVRLIIFRRCVYTVPELIDAKNAEQDKSLVPADFTNPRQDNKLLP